MDWKEGAAKTALTIRVILTKTTNLLKYPLSAGSLLSEVYILCLFYTVWCILYKIRLTGLCIGIGSIFRFLLNLRVRYKV